MKMPVKVKLDEGAKMPERAHEPDAGADIFSPMGHEAYTVKKGEKISQIVILPVMLCRFVQK